MYGGFETTTSTVPSSSGTASARSAKTRRRFGRGDVAGVLLRPDEGARRVLDGDDRGVRHLGREREGDGAAAGAEVDGERLGRGDGHQRVDRELRDELGLGPRHEDARPDGEVERAEGRASGDVLQRLAGGAALDRLEHGERVVVVHAGIGGDPRLHLAAAQAEHMADEQLGVDIGGRHVRGGEHLDGVVRTRAWSVERVVAGFRTGLRRRRAAPLRRPRCRMR